MIPFECDLCVFRKLRGSSPTGSEKDQLLMACIRRANLDAFWSRASSTVKGNKDRADNAIKLAKLVGLEGPFQHEGPFPEGDHCGYQTAILMLMNSRRPGRYSKGYTQFDTIRKLRSVYSNQVRAAPQSNQQVLALGDQKGAYQRFTQDVCGSFWFHRFLEGCRYRMGQDWRPNKGLSTNLILKMLEGIEVRIDGASSPEQLNIWTVFHTYAVVSYVVSLQGSEGFLLDLDGLNRHWKPDAALPYLTIALRGKIKGEHEDRCHLIPCTKITSSGIDVEATLARSLTLKTTQGHKEGPLVSTVQGLLLVPRDLDGCLHDVLSDILDQDPSLFPPSVLSHESVREKYQVFRSFRWSSDTRALEKAVLGTDIDVINRWQTKEAAKGTRPHRAMKQHYAEFELLLEPFLRYTVAM
jgi:hypothetical protein